MCKSGNGHFCYLVMAGYYVGRRGYSQIEKLVKTWYNSSINKRLLPFKKRIESLLLPNGIFFIRIIFVFPKKVEG